ncbi:diadenylate cyclase [Methanospirillum sp.]|uniref:diadenylate cyclase n=1 Tax=Methanospirillum sp. TaxID=45200 RepID=UPI00359FDDAF
MNTIPWYRYLMVFVVILISIIIFKPCFADLTDSTADIIAPMETAPVPLEETTTKTTIAPIHTKEPVVKPPVENTKPGMSPVSLPPTQSPTAKPTVTSAGTTPQATQATSNGIGNNETADTYFQWGIAYEDIGNCEAALAEYEKAIARDPYYADAWYHRILCYEKLGMFDELYDSYRFLLTLNPRYFSENVNATKPLVSNISPEVSPTPPGEETFLSGPFLWILIGTGVGGLIISSLVIYNIRRRPIIEGQSGLSRQSTGPVTEEEINSIADQVAKFYKGNRDICMQIIKLAIEIAREGREGKPVGTAFVLGDSDAVLERSRQLILNPLAGHSSEERKITNPDMRENIKELALLDGAFVIREDGTVEAAGRYISIDTGNVQLTKGFGTRHVSVAAITQETKAIGIVISESGGQIRIMAHGKIILETC